MNPTPSPRCKSGRFCSAPPSCACPSVVHRSSFRVGANIHTHPSARRAGYVVLAAVRLMVPLVWTHVLRQRGQRCFSSAAVLATLPRLRSVAGALSVIQHATSRMRFLGVGQPNKRPDGASYHSRRTPSYVRTKYRHAYALQDLLPTRSWASRGSLCVRPSEPGSGVFLFDTCHGVWEI